ncbi:CU044_2847 family protein [Streptomyces sp. NPDC003631]
MVEGLARLELEGGGSVLIEASPEAGGPVKAGRVAQTVQNLPVTLEAALGPVTDTARSVLRRLREAGPDEVEVEFGVDLAVEAGAVITKTGVGCHLKVKMTWRHEGTERQRDAVEE